MAVSIPLPTQHPQQFINASQLLSLLAVNMATLSQDLEVAVCEGQNMVSAKQARAGEIMQDNRFQDWLKSNRSTTLVVNGMESDGYDDVASSMTYFAGLLAQTLQRLGVALPLTFLCGQHAAPGDPLEATKGMMRALISQLLVAYGNTLDLSFINYQFLETVVVAQDISALCELFRGLMTSIKRGAVFCILDGVSWFESSTRIHDLAVAMTFFQSLTEEIDSQGRSSLIFKILISSPGVSQYAQDWFPPNSILWMKEEIEGDGHGVGVLQMIEATSLN